jgi:hypothetical protein
MARSNKKSASKKPAKKAARKRAAREGPCGQAKSAPPRKAKPRKPAAARKAASPPGREAGKSAPFGGNGKARKANGKEHRDLCNMNHKQKSAGSIPSLRGTEEKSSCKLRDAMVDSMAGVAQDTLRARG